MIKDYKNISVSKLYYLAIPMAASKGFLYGTYFYYHYFGVNLWRLEQNSVHRLINHRKVECYIQSQLLYESDSLTRIDRSEISPLFCCGWWQ